MYFTRSASGSNDKLSDVENGPAAINTVISVEPTRRKKNQNSVLNFQCKTCPSNAQKRSFIQCIIIYKKVKREELTLTYLILIQYIYIKESEKIDFYSMYL